jgi:hypothetical protein
MTAILSALLFVLFAGALVWLFLSTPASQLARHLSKVVPVVLALIGGFITLMGRGAIGIPLIVFGFAWWQRTRVTGPIRNTTDNTKYSTARSAALEMKLNHDTGDMEGRILSGHYGGKLLSEMKLENLLDLYNEILEDHKSAALLEAYLDRQFPQWREYTDANSDNMESGSSGSDGMTKREAYQILGLEPGASEQEIRKAWRNLMKGMHPDHGGSAFLAAKINTAKDILLN